MAITTVENLTLAFNEAQKMPTPAAFDAEGGAKIDFSNKEDIRILVLLENTASGEKTVTVEAGDGIQGVNPLSVSLEAKGSYAIVLESGKYMHTVGENSGCVVLKCDAEVKASAIELP